MFRSLFQLIYPELCAACGRHLYSNESVICSGCDLQLPRTGYHLLPGNEVEKVFWGRFPLHGATSYLHFRKGSRVQKLLHELKYNGAREVGEHLGKQLGRDLLNSGRYASAELVVPVPLHRSRMRLRGFNQSEAFAGGIAHSMGINVSATNLLRPGRTQTQTKKHRDQRWKNVSSAFELKDAGQFENREILLVDDVLTTGATLESCAKVILEQSSPKSLSIATIAYARA